ncbi:MAG: hypothetical protein KBG15_18515 [Kofleriaceae bacterium]|nr:hypothetical protein [Kofleriaceae bacterium]
MSTSHQPKLSSSLFLSLAVIGCVTAQTFSVAYAKPKTSKPRAATVIAPTGLVATPNADDRGYDTMLAIAGAKLSSLVLEPHLFVTYFGGGDSDENRHGSGAKHAMSMVGVLLESGKFVSATEITTLTLTSFQQGVLRFTISGTVPALNKKTWHCAAAPEARGQLEKTNAFHAYCTQAPAPTNTVPPMCNWASTMLSLKGITAWPADEVAADQRILQRIVMQYQFIEPSTRSHTSWIKPSRATYRDATPTTEPWTRVQPQSLFTYESCPIPPVKP